MSQRKQEKREERRSSLFRNAGQRMVSQKNLGQSVVDNSLKNNKQRTHSTGGKTSALNSADAADIGNLLVGYLNSDEIKKEISYINSMKKNG